MDKIDRAIIAELQTGFPICAEPFAELSARLGMEENVLIDRVDQLLAAGVLSRFGPLYNVEEMGGHYSLVAMRVPASEVDRVAEVINQFPEVAHNYEREHEFNLWFVLAVENLDRKNAVLAEITTRSGYPVYDLPKLREFYVGVKFDV
jgi:DNA-binding Lrp family transcriptional regulator